MNVMERFVMRALVLFTVTAALAGCRRQQPPTEVPPSPRVELFTASAATSTPGAGVTLSWKVVNATGLELREATLGSLNVAADAFEGSVTVRPVVTSLYVLTVRGEAGTDARALAVTVPPGAGAVSFQALPPEVAGGDVTTLVWLAPGAQTVTLRAGATPLDTGGQRTSGAVSVRPLEDTTYTLDVDGAPHVANVTVQPAILDFTAERTAVAAGAPVHLAWRGAGATRVQLTSVGRGVLFESTAPGDVQAGGFADVAPERPEDGVVTYELVVEKGPQRMTRRLDVFVGVGIGITRLDAPAVAAQGGTYIVRWQTYGADEVELRIDGAPTFTTANPAQAANGFMSLPTPADDFGVELIAISHRGPRVARSTQVEVVGTPTGITLTAAPSTVSAGGAVTLAWSSPESRRVRITDGDGQPVYSVTGSMAESGSTVVYPPHDGTTYRITADNLLGSAPVAATAGVTVTGAPLDVTPVPGTSVSGATFAATASDAQAVLVGFPHGQVLSGTRADFLDISATGQQLDITSSPGVTTVATGFDTWLWGVKQTPQLTVSRAGWMAFGAPLVSVVTELALPHVSAPRGIIAPLWDDLRITASSGVYWQVVGAAPNERLIVQWSRLQVGTNTSTEVTFQAQVHQNGSVAFRYGTMNVPQPYTSFVIGLQDLTATRAVTSSGVPDSDSALYFFSPVVDAATLRATRGTTWGGFVQKNGVSALVSRRASVLSMPEDLAVTELMFDPRVPGGQYAELLNRTAAPLDLSGWYVSAPGGQRFDFPAGFTLPVDTPVVLGASLDAAENDDAGVTVAWGGFSLPRDGGALFMGVQDAGFTLPITPDGGTGAATVVDPGLFRVGSNVSRVVVCNAQTTFGAQTPPQRGNPGAHAGCGFGYRSVAIAPHFVDISDGGTALVNSATAQSALTTPITLAASPAEPQPRVFGVPTPVVSMSIDGFIAPYATSAVAATNKSSPATTTAPRGVIAPFWDDLQTTPALTPASDLYWKFIAAGEDPLRPEAHWIFQWHRVRHLNTSPPDDLNFEVKLFESGVIEYHYGAMTSGTIAGYADGNSATVWLEYGDAGVALVESVDTPSVRPHSAIRFIPQ